MTELLCINMGKRRLLIVGESYPLKSDTKQCGCKGDYYVGINGATAGVEGLIYIGELCNCRYCNKTYLYDGRIFFPKKYFATVGTHETEWEEAQHQELELVPLNHSGLTPMQQEL